MHQGEGSVSARDAVDETHLARATAWILIAVTASFRRSALAALALRALARMVFLSSWESRPDPEPRPLRPNIFAGPRPAPILRSKCDSNSSGDVLIKASRTSMCRVRATMWESESTSWVVLVSGC